ncbi:hypothetical protein ACFL3V_07145 [Nanoarchaeota archaeon]
MMRKKAEMTFPVIVAIVIGLVILAIFIYMISGKSRDLVSGTSCPDNECSAFKSDGTCPPDKPVKSFTPCKVKKLPGRCCVAEG